MTTRPIQKQPQIPCQTPEPFDFKGLNGWLSRATSWANSRLVTPDECELPGCVSLMQNGGSYNAL